MAASVEHSQTLSGEAAETGRGRPLNGLDGVLWPLSWGQTRGGTNQNQPTRRSRFWKKVPGGVDRYLSLGTLPPERVREDSNFPFSQCFDFFPRQSHHHNRTTF